MAYGALSVWTLVLVGREAYGIEERVVMEPYEAMSGTRLCELDAKGYGSAGLELERRANAYPELVAEVERLRDFSDADSKRLFDELRAAYAEVKRLRTWIDTEGRNCPSNTTIDAVLKDGTPPT